MARLCRFGVNAEAGGLIGTIAPPDPKIEPSLRHQIDDRGLLGKQNRIVPRHDGDRGAKADLRRHAREVAEKRQGRAELAVAGKMMLDKKDGLESEPLGLDNIVDEILIRATIAD